MNEESQKYFYDALAAARAIICFAQNKTFEDYCSDDLLSAAIERKFEIIGEALNRIRRKFPADLEVIGEFPAIIGFRNILVHGYDHVEDSVVWGIVIKELPELIKELEGIPGMNSED